MKLHFLRLFLYLNDLNVSSHFSVHPWKILINSFMEDLLVVQSQRYVRSRQATIGFIPQSVQYLEDLSYCK